MQKVPSSVPSISSNRWWGRSMPEDLLSIRVYNTDAFFGHSSISKVCRVSPLIIPFSHFSLKPPKDQPSHQQWCLVKYLVEDMRMFWKDWSIKQVLNSTEIQHLVANGYSNPVLGLQGKAKKPWMLTLKLKKKYSASLISIIVIVMWTVTVLDYRGICLHTEHLKCTENKTLYINTPPKSGMRRNGNLQREQNVGRS